MKKSLFYVCALVITTFLSCGVKQKGNAVITVKNNLDIPRAFETVEILKADLNLTENQNFEAVEVRDKLKQVLVVSQFVDQDGDGAADVLLFQPKLEPNSEKQYELVLVEAGTAPVAKEYCYSRFVPERTDDYAWENNKVAFRTYGPTAQKMIEDSVPGGTLSSGIDAWLKKVDYPIINKWYAANVKEIGYYHKDHGEGLDNFHVGSSRGVGGTAVKKDSTYYISKNFTEWKTITNGPIRTSFVLNYADWDADGQKITEEKHISLDYGNNFSKFEIHVTGTDVLSVGLTLHENDGEITENPEKGWISYWEPNYFDSEIGTAIVAKKENMIASEYYVTSMKDRSNLYSQLKVDNNKVVYYAGFAWKKSNQYPTKASWEKYLDEFALKINNPLEVVLKK
ncbi:uncharacterized protein DUF4861 [Mariniflexile fucanivorans]|uniref:Uncharacterized protein DUF4861 n=1 Tax=Mariniflexile fucanivorans TaxID=264023 RepID=A0A4R1RJE6_9FLAO|nr:DUF4861 domain-containing protein [Mariniflexile fucanivorans]TCL66264.1 uncharacterized protein DUF4861 [Mariniflexile fucanivorans]